MAWWPFKRNKNNSVVKDDPEAASTEKDSLVQDQNLAKNYGSLQQDSNSTPAVKQKGWLQSVKNWWHGTPQASAAAEEAIEEVPEALTTAQKVKKYMAASSGAVDSALTSLAFLIFGTLGKTEDDRHNETEFGLETAILMTAWLVATYSGSWLRYYELAERATGEDDEDLTLEDVGSRTAIDYGASIKTLVFTVTAAFDAALAGRLLSSDPIATYPIMITFGALNGLSMLYSNAAASWGMYLKHHPTVLPLPEQFGIRHLFKVSPVAVPLIVNGLPTLTGLVAGKSAYELTHEVMDMEPYSTNPAIETPAIFLGLLAYLGCAFYAKHFDVGMLVKCIKGTNPRFTALTNDNFLETSRWSAVRVAGQVASGTILLTIMAKLPIKNSTQAAIFIARVGAIIGGIALAVDAMEQYMFSEDRGAVDRRETGVAMRYYMDSTNEVVTIAQGPAVCPKHTCGALSGQRLVSSILAPASVQAQSHAVKRSVEEEMLRRRGYQISHNEPEGSSHESANSLPSPSPSA